LTLTTRLSLFFLTMLGIVLVGFSTMLYLLARGHLNRQEEERLDAAMNTLVAAVEVGPDRVEWERGERHLTLGQGVFGDQIVWQVSDDKGRVVDRSDQPASEDLLAEAFGSLQDTDQARKNVEWRGERWQLSQRWIRPASGKLAKSSEAGQVGEPTKYPALSITGAVSLDPVRVILRRLAAVLVGLSMAIWLVALFLGRAVSRRALQPVTRMAASARGMDAADLRQRLPVTRTGDELENLARAFNGLLDRLQESFERQQRFTGDASHQLRNPLAAMLGQIEVALRRERPPQEYQRVLTSVQRQGLHLRQIVEALLFLARADAEAHLPHLEHIDLTSWLAEHVRRDHPRATDLRADLPSDPRWVEAHESLLSQLVDILVENAMKYSEPGTPITLRLRSENARVCLSVEDRGCGIAVEDLGHVFEPFYRSPRARSNGVSGIGLGLAIAERIAVALGGTIIGASEPGQGSCFTLRLPSAPSPDSVPNRIGDGPPLPPQDAGLSCKK